MTYAQGPTNVIAPFPPLVINVDQRTGLTAADSGAITLFSAGVAGHLLECIITVVCTAYTSGTPKYTLAWTEGGVSYSKSCTVSAADVYSFIANIQPDTGTSVTVQVTGTFSATVDVATTAKVIV